MVIIILVIIIILILLSLELFDNTQEDFGFIVTRHVNSEETNKYWIECVDNIRKNYNNKIIIIDDNSNKDFLDENITFDNCVFINSEFPGAGELLGYYYLHKYKFFKKAIIIHDSLFVIKKYDYNSITDCKFLFHVNEHRYDEDEYIIPSLEKLNNSNYLIDRYKNKNDWHLCFGVQSVISLDFLEKIENKYNFLGLINHIDTRKKRMGLERIFGLLCIIEKPELYDEPSIYGDIMHYQVWGYTFKNYTSDKNNNNLSPLNVIKVWTGR